MKKFAYGEISGDSVELSSGAYNFVDKSSCVTAHGRRPNAIYAAWLVLRFMKRNTRLPIVGVDLPIPTQKGPYT